MKSTHIVGIALAILAIAIPNSEEKSMKKRARRAAINTLVFTEPPEPRPPPRAPPTVSLHLQRFSMTVLTKRQQVRLSTAVKDGEALTDCQLCNTCGTDRTEPKGCTDTDGLTYIFGGQDKELAQQLSGPVDKDSLPVISDTCIIFTNDDISLLCTLVSVADALRQRK